MLRSSSNFTNAGGSVWYLYCLLIIYCLTKFDKFISRAAIVKMAAFLIRVWCLYVKFGNIIEEKICSIEKKAYLCITTIVIDKDISRDGAVGSSSGS